MSDAALRPDVVLINACSSSELITRAARMANTAVDAPNKAASCITDVWFTAFFDGTSNSIFDEEVRPPNQQAF